MPGYRSSKKPLRLSDAEYRYLKDGEIADGYIERGGKERTDKLRKQVEDRVELLPDRFEILAEDIKQLHHGRFEPENDDIEISERNDYPKSAEGDHYQPLDTETGFDAWLSLMGFEERPTNREIRAALTYSVDGRGSAPADFGRQLGLLAHRLMRWPDLEGIENEDIEADLIWGFLEGLCFDWRTAGENTPDLVKDVATEMLDRMEQRIEPAAELRRDVLEPLTSGEVGEMVRRSNWLEVRCDMANRTNEILANEGITTGRELGLEDEERVYSGAEDDEARLCYKIVDYILADIDSDTSINSFRQLQRFNNEYDPRDGIDLDTIVTEDRVYRILDENRLQELLQALDLVKSDAERLQEKPERRGVSAVDVFEQIAEANGCPTSSEIGNRLAKYVGNVSRVAKDLAGLDCGGRERHEVWINRPLLVGDHSGWEMTNYGEAVYHYLNALESPWGDNMIPDSVLLDAMDEIEVSPPS